MSNAVDRTGLYIMVFLGMIFSYDGYKHALEAHKHAHEAVNACSAQPVFDSEGKRIGATHD